MTDRTARPTFPWPWALGIDVVLVVVFATIGRASHAHALDALGIAETAWPFLVGLAVGWLALLAWRAPAALLRTGLPLVAITVVAGMLLRLLTNAGTAPAFIVVATVTLAVFLLGWRATALLIARRRA